MSFHSEDYIFESNARWIVYLANFIYTKLKRGVYQVFSMLVIGHIPIEDQLLCK